MSAPENLESAWRSWKAGSAPPRWSDYLPPEPRDPDEALCLLQIDVEFRARAGLPGLLAEPYLDLVALDVERQAELLRWECRQRWKHGVGAHPAEYRTLFPQHATVLESLAEAMPGTIPAASLPPAPEPTGTLDLRRHELLDSLGAGGMGEVYRTRDPGLGRDLALKVLRPAFASNPSAEARFLREARITASLQHPSIVPVHNLGRLPDGRLFFSMKLVRGRTLDALIHDKAPGLMSVYERVCEAVAHAHGQGVIHRDLKPANVMVGGFGEVQVMDWGLALDRASRWRESAEEGPISSDDRTAAGTVMGTPAFMPPEQARGEELDERADVFSLGAILCVLLTGRAPYSRDDLMARARAGDLADAFACLDGCGADADLVLLCKECLAPDREGRPKDAGAVASRMADHHEGVERRLRAAELERVEAREAGRRMRLRVVLMGVVTLLALSAVGVWAWLRQKQADTDRAAGEALAQARLRRSQAWEDPLNVEGILAAVREAKSAEDLLANGGSPALAAEARQLHAELREDAAAAREDRTLLARLLDAMAPGRFHYETAGNRLQASAAPSVDARVVSAFSAWKLDIEGAPEDEILKRLRACPPAVAREIAAALDGWWLERRHARQPRDARLLRLASAIDPSSSELRGLLSGNRFAIPPALLAASLVGRAAPVSVPTSLHIDHLNLLSLHGRADLQGPPQSLALLARVLASAGESALAERLLRDAVHVRPGEAFLHQTLAHFLSTSSPPRWDEAAECLAAARALRPELALSLGHALFRAGQGDRALLLLSRVAKASPDDVHAGVLHADVLSRPRPDEALAEYNRVLRVAPDNPLALCNMSLVLLRRGDAAGAADACRRALKADPELVPALGNLASALLDLGEPGEALKAADAALKLKELAALHYVRGIALMDLKQFKAAAGSFRRASELNPTDFRSHGNLGKALLDDGDISGAIQAYRRAVAIEPRYGLGHLGLGGLLLEANRPKEAIAPLLVAVRLMPSMWQPHAALGQALLDTGRRAEAADSLRRALKLLPPDDPNRPAIQNKLSKALKK